MCLSGHICHVLSGFLKVCGLIGCACVCCITVYSRHVTYVWPCNVQCSSTMEKGVNPLIDSVCRCGDGAWCVRLWAAVFEPLLSADEWPPCTATQICKYCSTNKGACTECSELHCKTTFHVACGLKQQVRAHAVSIVQWHRLIAFPRLQPHQPLCVPASSIL